MFINNPSINTIDDDNVIQCIEYCNNTYDIFINQERNLCETISYLLNVNIYVNENNLNIYNIYRYRNELLCFFVKIYSIYENLFTTDEYIINLKGNTFKDDIDIVKWKYEN